MVPIGGGGLISGIALAVKAIRPEVRVVGVEPEGASVVWQSLRAGKPLRAEKIETVADGLGAPFTTELPLWPGSNMVTVVARTNSEVKSIKTMYVYRDPPRTAQKP